MQLPNAIGNHALRADLSYICPEWFKNNDGTFVKGDGIQDDTTGFQAALNFARDNNIPELQLQQNTYRITASLKLPTFVSLKGKLDFAKTNARLNKSSTLFFDTSTPSSLFVPDRTDSSQGNWRGSMENIIFHTHLTSFYVQNNKHNCFFNFKFENGSILNCLFGGFNIAFNKVYFSWCGEVKATRIFNCIEAVFKDCDVNDYQFFDNYFSGGKVTSTTDNKTTMPYLFKNLGNFSMCNFQRNWSEFFIMCFEQKTRISENSMIIGNLFDYCMHLADFEMSNLQIINNSFHNCSKKRIVDNILLTTALANISTDVMSKNQIEFIRITSRTQVQNNMCIGYDKGNVGGTYGDFTSKFVFIKNDIGNKTIQQVKINGNNGVDHLVENIITFAADTSFTIDDASNMIGNDIQQTNNVEFLSLPNINTMLPGMLFRYKNNRIRIFHDRFNKIAYATNVDGTPVNFTTRSLLKNYNASDVWNTTYSGLTLTRENNYSLLVTSSTTGWKTAESQKMSVTANEYIRFAINADTKASDNTSTPIVELYFYDATNTKVATRYPNTNTEYFYQVPANAVTVSIALRINLQTSNATWRYKEYSLNTFSTDIKYTCIKSDNSRWLTGVSNGVQFVEAFV